MPTKTELKMLQALPLKAKILKTQARIREWVTEYGEDGVYVSFSGGKDSTVLLDIVRNRCGYKNIKAVFFDTGLEYPEIKAFVNSFENIDVVRPKKTFKQTVDEFGYPIFTKNISECIYYARKEIENNPDKDIKDMSVRTKIMHGMLEHKEKGVETDEYSNMYNYSKYKFMLDADFKVGSKCCQIMKKNPAKLYHKQTGRHPMTAQMATESRQRENQWLINGCNGFNMKKPISNPMSFWTEQDVLQYIYENDTPIASVYGKVTYDDEVIGQLSFFDDENKHYCTTGCERTGCMFCLYGIHLEKSPNRLEQMKITHPKIYDYVMKSEKMGGLGYKDKIDWINANGNLNIKY